MVSNRQELMMGYPWVGFYQFCQLPKGIYAEYKMYFVDKIIINGFAFYIHNN